VLVDVPNLTEAATARGLVAIKTLRTAIWAFFASSIVAIPALAWTGRIAYAAWLIAVVFVEVLVIVLNGGRCPLTGIAARYTSDRRDNFDIYLPQWVARYNKLIFGGIYICGVLVTVLVWGSRRA
jgi:hypothetical protein